VVLRWQAHPQASKLRPQELQKALSLAFKELRKSKVVLLWQWGSTIWRIGAMSYGAFTVYTNPWLVRTLLQVSRHHYSLSLPFSLPFSLSPKEVN